MRFLLPVVLSLFALGFTCMGEEDAVEEKTDAAADAKKEEPKEEEVVKEEPEEEEEGEEGEDAEEGDDGGSARGGKAGKAGKGQRGVSFAQAKVVCCNHDRIDKALTEYLDVHQNLFKDQPSTGDANALWGHLDAAANDASLPTESRDTARRAADEVAEMRDSDNTVMRQHLDAISGYVYELVNRHKGSGSHTVAHTLCPLQGGQWIQTSSTVQNPYNPSGICGHFEP